MSASPSSPNGLLASLVPADFELLRPYLKPIEFKQEAVLYSAGDKIDRVYFPHSGIISLVVELAGGEMIEAAMVGRDSMLGATSARTGRFRSTRPSFNYPGEAKAWTPIVSARWPRRARRSGPSFSATSKCCSRRPSSPRHAMPLMSWRRGCRDGCCGHAICPGATPWNSPRNFLPRCSGCDGAAFRRWRTTFNSPVSSAMRGVTSRLST
jgi:hypothetical protein